MWGVEECEGWRSVRGGKCEGWGSVRGGKCEGWGSVRVGKCEGWKECESVGESVWWWASACVWLPSGCNTLVHSHDPLHW